jgi:hypothetical protein
MSRGKPHKITVCRIYDQLKKGNKPQYCSSILRDTMVSGVESAQPGIPDINI